MKNRIEVGCLVLIHGLVRDVENNGSSGVVTKRAFPGEILGEFGGKIGYTPNGGWVVESPSIDDGLGVFQDKNLLRIDDYTEETETQEEEMVV